MSANSTAKDTRTGVKLQPARRGRGRVESPSDARTLAALTLVAVVMPVALYFAFTFAPALIYLSLYPIN